MLKLLNYLYRLLSTKGVTIHGSYFYAVVVDLQIML